MNFDFSSNHLVLVSLLFSVIGYSATPITIDPASDLRAQNEARCLSKCGHYEPTKPAEYRILGGGPVLDATQPAVVRIQFDIKCGDNHLVTYACSGFIISEHHVLSAQHCFWSDLHRLYSECALPAQKNFIGGEWLQLHLETMRVFPNINAWPAPSAPYHRVKAISLPKGFDNAAAKTNLQATDYALLTVDPPFDFTTSNARSICLPRFFTETALVLEPDAMYMQAGWGRRIDEHGKPIDTQDKLVETFNQLQPQTYCDSVHRGYGYDPKVHLCGGMRAHGGMQGDSGSAMQMSKNGRMFAVGLFTEAAVGTKNRQYHPDVFIKTESMCDFIEKETGKTLCIHYSTPRDFVCERVLMKRKERLMNPADNKLVYLKAPLPLPATVHTTPASAHSPSSKGTAEGWSRVVDRFCTHGGPQSCPEAFVCIQMLCRLRCSSGNQCPDGYFCYRNSRCERDNLSMMRAGYTRQQPWRGVRPEPELRRLYRLTLAGPPDEARVAVASAERAALGAEKHPTEELLQ